MTKLIEPKMIRYAMHFFSKTPINEEECKGCGDSKVCISLHPELRKVIYKDGIAKRRKRFTQEQVEQYPEVFGGL